MPIKGAGVRVPSPAPFFFNEKWPPTETHKKTAQSSHPGAIFLFYKHPSTHSHPNLPGGCFAIFRELRKSYKGRASRTPWHFVPRDAAFALFGGLHRPHTPMKAQGALPQLIRKRAALQDFPRVARMYTNRARRFTKFLLVVGQKV